MRRTTFWILCLEGAVLSFNVAASAAVVPSISKDFGVSAFLAGRAVWFYMLPYGMAALLYGPLIRWLDAKRVELVCLFCFSLANLFAGLAKSINALFLARFLMGLFGASVIPLALIIISRKVESQKRGRKVGIFFGSSFIASLLGLFLSGIVNWRWIYLIPCLLGFILWLHMYFYLPSFAPEKSSMQFNYLAALKNKTLLAIFSYIFMVSLLYHGVQQWLGVYFYRSFNLHQFVISMLITLTSLSGIFGEVLGGWFADILGRIKTVNLGILLMLFSILFLILLKVGVIFVLALIMIIWGLGWTFNHAGLSTILTDLPDEFLNESASLNSSVRFISGGLGAALGGWLFTKSFPLGFIIFGSGLLALLFFGRRLKGEENYG